MYFWLHTEDVFVIARKNLLIKTILELMYAFCNWKKGNCKYNVFCDSKLR